MAALNDRLAHDRVELQVGALDTVPKHLLLRLVQQAQNGRSCKINIVEGHIGDLLDGLKEHRLDLVVSDVAPNVTSGVKIRSRNIAKMPVVIVGSPKFGHLAENFPESLRGQPFILSATQSRVRDEIESYLATKGIDVDIVAEVQDTSLLKLLATHDIGLIPAPATAVEELLASNSLVLIGALDDIVEELWVVMAERKIQNPAALFLFSSFRL
jgi:LysR family transcriptional activator of nhaA